MHHVEQERFVSVACVNFHTKWGDKKANLRNIETAVQEAARGGSQIIVFPELALSGYECDDGIQATHQSCAMHRELAETVPGPSTRLIENIAKDLGVYIVFGMPEQDRNDPDRRYISSVIVAPHGILGAYRKLHLAPSPRFNEDICFTPGHDIPVWETRYGLVGILICYDFWYFPELARIMALKGARLLINTTASAAGPGKPYFIVQQTGCRATENIVYAASANLVGQERSLSFAGHSVIAGPLGTRPAHIFIEAGASEEMISATLDFKKLQIRNESMPWQKSRQSKLINEEFLKFDEPVKSDDSVTFVECIKRNWR
jgi:predicted amidohydrolase